MQIYDNLLQESKFCFSQKGDTMSHFFEYKQTCRHVSFCYTDSTFFTEREIHPYHEILYFMDGSTFLLTEHFKIKPEKGSLILIPSGSYHLFQPESKNPFTHLKISFYAEAEYASAVVSAMKELTIIKQPGNTLLFLFNRICSYIAASPTDENSGLFLYGAFLMLLSELNREKNLRQTQLPNREKLISQCINYIDQHLSENLSLETIADQLTTSSSSLTHTFKEAMGISLHKYIVEKRLFHAHRLIQENRNPTTVYLECGYGDYSSFYKAYVKMFGYPPSRSSTQL